MRSMKAFPEFRFFLRGGRYLYSLVSFLWLVLCSIQLDDKLLLRTKIMNHALHGRIARALSFPSRGSLSLYRRICLVVGAMRNTPG